MSDKKKKGFWNKIINKKLKKKKSESSFGDTLWAIEESTNQEEETSKNKNQEVFYESNIDKMFQNNTDGDSLYSEETSGFEEEKKSTFKIKYKKWEYTVIIIEILIIVYTVLVFTNIIPF